MNWMEIVALVVGVGMVAGLYIAAVDGVRDREAPLAPRRGRAYLDDDGWVPANPRPGEKFMRSRKLPPNVRYDAATYERFMLEGVRRSERGDELRRLYGQPTDERVGDVAHDEIVEEPNDIPEWHRDPEAQRHYLPQSGQRRYLPPRTDR